MCRVRGRGVQPCGLRVEDDPPPSFVVDTSGAGDGELECSLVNRGARIALHMTTRGMSTSTSTVPLLNAYLYVLVDGKQLHVQMKRVGASQFECSYEIEQPDLLCAHVRFGGVPITNSPFVIDVAPRLTYPESNVSVTGAGADARRPLYVGREARFTVQWPPNVGALIGSLREEIEGPAEDTVRCFEKNTTGEAEEECSYVPTQAGDYAVSVLANEEHVRGSPFVVEARPRPEAQLELEHDVRISGPGVQREGVRALRETYFEVDLSRIAEKLAPDPPARPRALVMFLDGVMPHTLSTECEAPRDAKTCLYKFKYTPDTFGEHTVTVLYEGRPTSRDAFPVRTSTHCSCV